MCVVRERNTFYVHGPKCVRFTVCEWLGLSVYSSISGGALRFRILPIMTIIKINKQLIDRPCFKFPPIISGAMSLSREDGFKKFTYTGPHGSNKNRHRNYQEWKNNHRGIIVLFFFAMTFWFFILEFSIIQINEAQRGGLTGIILAVHALTPRRECFTRLDYQLWPGHNKSEDSLMITVGFVLTCAPPFVKNKI